MVDVAELRRLEAEATKSRGDGGGFAFEYSLEPPGMIFTVDALGEEMSSLFDGGVDCTDAEVVFTVALRNAAPALLDELERLRKREAELVDLLTERRSIEDEELAARPREHGGEITDWYLQAMASLAVRCDKWRKATEVALAGGETR